LGPVKVDGLELEEIPLQEFLDHYFSPEPGQHVCLVGPNGCGKTTIGMQLLVRFMVMYDFLTGVALVMKPHKGPKSDGKNATGDRTVAALVRKYGGRITRVWPPRKLLPWQKRPTFWGLWPKSVNDPKVDKPEHHDVFRTCLLDTFNTGDSVVFADEAAGLADDLDLDEELIQTLTRGRSMKASAILATQRPRFVPRAMFSEAKHFFLWKMSDLGEYERVREIGGGQLTRQQIVAVLQRLKKHQCLYLYPDQQIACVLV
jgi:hypothetical protein